MLSSRFVQSFQIRSVDGGIQTGPIDRLDRLVDFLLERGISDIAKVSFYIVDTQRPEEFCNIILRQREGYFFPEYCETNQVGDFTMVLEALEYGNLDDMFVQYIRRSDTILS